MQRACILSCALFASNASFAGGFALIEHGASGLGNAYAGAAAVSDDASTVWFNPAGMSEIKDRQVLVAGHVIGVTSEFGDRGTSLNPNFTAGNIGNVDTGFGTADALGPVDANGTSIIPNLFYVHPINAEWTFGLGVTVPFGNSTDYDPGWVGRYQAVESSVATLDINPSFAFRASDKVSLGGGISLQKFTADLGSAIDSGAVCIAATGDPAVCGGIGLAPGVAANDGFANISGDSTAYTFNIGALIKPKAGTKIGVTYRHEAKHELEGDADFTNNATLETLLGGTPVFVDVPATAKATLPSMVMLSAAHEVDDQLELLVDATYTGWSSRPELKIEYSNPLQDPTVNELGYNDVWRVSAGFNYEYSDDLTIRGGVAYDEDPVPSPKLRTARIPGNERTWVALGLGYKFNSKVKLDVGFAHLMIDDTPIDNNVDPDIGTTLRGVFETSANILSAQVSVQFD